MLVQTKNEMMAQEGCFESAWLGEFISLRGR